MRCSCGVGGFVGEQYGTRCIEKGKNTGFLSFLYLHTHKEEGGLCLSGPCWFLMAKSSVSVIQYTKWMESQAVSWRSLGKLSTNLF